MWNGLLTLDGQLFSMPAIIRTLIKVFKHYQTKIYNFLAALRLQSMPPPSSYIGCWRFDARLVYHPIYSINPTYTTYFIYFIFVCWQYDKLSPHMCNEHINHQTNYLGNMQNTHVESTANGKTSSLFLYFLTLFWEEKKTFQFFFFRYDQLCFYHMRDCLCHLLWHHNLHSEGDWWPN